MSHPHPAHIVQAIVRTAAELSMERHRAAAAALCERLALQLAERPTLATDHDAALSRALQRAGERYAELQLAGGSGPFPRMG